MVRVKVALAIALIALVALGTLALLALSEDAVDVMLEDVYEKLANYGPEDSTPYTLILELKVLETLESLSDLAFKILPL